MTHISNKYKLTTPFLRMQACQLVTEFSRASRIDLVVVVVSNTLLTYVLK